jgi:hypothetical protein
MTQPFLAAKNILNGISKRSKTKLNNKINIKFDDLYSLLCKESLLIQAYGNLHKNKGKLTPGTSDDTIDSM